MRDPEERGGLSAQVVPRSAQCAAFCFRLRPGSPVLPGVSFPGNPRPWVLGLPSPTAQTQASPGSPCCCCGRAAGPGGPGEPCPLTGSRVPSQSVVRTCCIRSFGHFVARLQGSILQFSAEAGIFVSIARSEQEGVLQQAQAQFRMVSHPPPPRSWLPPGAVSTPAGGPLTEEGGERGEQGCGAGTEERASGQGGSGALSRGSWSRPVSRLPGLEGRLCPLLV